MCNCINRWRRLNARAFRHFMCCASLLRKIYVIYKWPNWHIHVTWSSGSSTFRQMFVFCPREYIMRTALKFLSISIIDRTYSFALSKVFEWWHFNLWVGAWRYVFGLSRRGSTIDFHLLWHTVESLWVPAFVYHSDLGVKKAVFPLKCWKQKLVGR